MKKVKKFNKIFKILNDITNNYKVVNYYENFNDNYVKFSMENTQKEIVKINIRTDINNFYKNVKTKDLVIVVKNYKNLNPIKLYYSENLSKNKKFDYTVKLYYNNKIVNNFSIFNKILAIINKKQNFKYFYNSLLEIFKNYKNKHF